MPAPERSVLHVLPHPGGGGETYVELLAGMPGYRFSRISIAPSADPVPLDLARGVAAVARRARRHDVLHVHGEVASGLCLPLLAVRPSVVTLHGLHMVRRSSGARRAAATLNLRAVLHLAARAICVSEAERDELIRVAGPVATRRAVVVRNGVRVPPASEGTRADVRAALGIAELEPVAIWIGSLDERKDPLLAARAAERAAVTLLVVGDGPLRAQVDRAGGARVRVLGQRADVPSLLDAADVYLLTSRREGLALSLLEAMAHGLPAVVTDLPENVEAIGDAGIAFPRNDEAALVAALRQLVDADSERAVLGERVLRRAVELFGVERMIAQTHAIYDEALAGRRSSSGGTGREQSAQR